MTEFSPFQLDAFLLSPQQNDLEAAREELVPILSSLPHHHTLSHSTHTLSHSTLSLSLSHTHTRTRTQPITSQEARARELDQREKQLHDKENLLQHDSRGGAARNWPPFCPVLVFSLASVPAKHRNLARIAFTYFHGQTLKQNNTHTNQKQQNFSRLVVLKVQLDSVSLCLHVSSCVSVCLCSVCLSVGGVWCLQCICLRLC